MGLNASAGFNFLNLNNNPYTNHGNENITQNQSSNETSFPMDTAGTVGANDGTYNMPQGSIYDTAGSVAYNYYNTSFSTGSNTSETAGSIASATSGGASVSSFSSGGASSISSSASSSGSGSSSASSSGGSPVV